MVYNDLMKHLFKKNSLGWYKHLCGEYLTASSFGLWLAAMILKNEHVPETVLLEGKKPVNPRNIIIYNHYRNIDHSLMLVTTV
jgi:hypothetical protein